MTTFCRLIREYELLKDDVGENKRRLAFSMQYANQLWQADTMFGHHVQRRQTKLIAFLDDASRVLCHGEFFFEENSDSMIQAIRAAFYKRGVPEQLLVDNGSIYCCQEITLVCARVGCILRHTAVRDAAAKGKIERFFRRVRDSSLSATSTSSSLDELNRQFAQWVEHEYNATEHSTLGMKPIDASASIWPASAFSRLPRTPTNSSTPRRSAPSNKTTPSASRGSATKPPSICTARRLNCVTNATERARS